MVVTNKYLENKVDLIWFVLFKTKSYDIRKDFTKEEMMTSLIVFMKQMSLIGNFSRYIFFRSYGHKKLLILT